jgi:hypothetical protein
MRHLPLREFGYAVGFLVLLAALYVGAYYAMVEPTPLPIMMGVGPWRMNANYRFGGESSAAFFSPLEELDRRFFPGRWLFDF